MAEKAETRVKDSLELATFYVGEALCGMDILQVQEINKIMMRTPVPQAPDYVLGVLNLRGKIVTIIDLSKKLGLGVTEQTDDSRNIIVNSYDGSAGFLVNRIGDVMRVQTGQKEKPPANMQGIQGRYFSGVYKMDSLLVGMLDIDKVMDPDD